MLFDCWAGVLSPGLFRAHVVRTTRDIVAELRRRHPGVPVIGFPRLAGLLVGEYVRSTRVDAVGMDTGMDVALVRSSLPSDVALQGQPGSDGAGLGRCGPAKRGSAVLKAMHGCPSVFNLGHGIMPQTPPGARGATGGASACGVTGPAGWRSVSVQSGRRRTARRRCGRSCCNLFRDPAILRVPFFDAGRCWRGSSQDLGCGRRSRNYALLGGSSPLLDADPRPGRGACKRRCPDLKVVASSRCATGTRSARRRRAPCGPGDRIEVVLLPLYPQYSTTTTGSSWPRGTRLLRKLVW